MYAKVIVDVPSVRTDRPFTYEIPRPLEPFVKIGSRVIVPFGSRRVQGYVLDIGAESEVKEIRPILDVPDVEPLLTPELLRLASWMSERYICPFVTAIQTILPAVLQAKSKKYVRLCEEAWGGELARLPEEEEIASWLRDKGRAEWEVLRRRFPQQESLLNEWVKKGKLRLEQEFAGRVAKKKEKIVRRLAPPARLREELSRLPPQAVRQRDVIRFFLEEEREAIPLNDLLSRLGIGRSAVFSLEGKGLIEIRETEAFRDPFAGRPFAADVPPPLTDEQQGALHELLPALAQRKHVPFLLHGVTGSGKTEVYLRAIAETIARGREAIVLVPEISLTPQMVERFKARFGDLVAVLHSRLSPGERYDEWRKIRRGLVRVAVGARSAIFAPFTNLGLIIVDEEHESSYKQEESPRYHARDVALFRGKAHRAVVVLGSATPSLESYHEAGKGEYRLLSMQHRVGGRALPRVHLVDLREELREGNRSMFSRLLRRMIEERLARREQIVLFLNRRGFSTFVMCRSCGYVAECPHCDISLTFHSTNRTVRCHYCGYAERAPTACPACGSGHIRFFGAGTQKVEEQLARNFPGIRVIRMDVDTTAGKGAHEKLLSQFREGKADVLLGTQMIAKGLDFPRVTLVGVVAADTTLRLPDFRAGEKTFQLLTQVSGRAGRHELPGDVVIQTYMPEHYAVQYACRHDYARFFQHEIRLRQQQGYPPFCRLVLFTFSHDDLPSLIKTAEQFTNRLKHRLGGRGGTRVLGPVASPLARIKDRYRMQCMVKYNNDPLLKPDVMEGIREVYLSFLKENRDKRFHVTVDVDPQVLM
ncbi:primosomal protein N' [Bacillaceae bacterium]